MNHETQFDCLILGAGIASCSLALELNTRGLRVAIIDSAPDLGASDVASAMMHPYLLGKARDQSLVQRLFLQAREWYLHHSPECIRTQEFLTKQDKSWSVKSEGLRVNMRVLRSQLKRLCYWHTAAQATYVSDSSSWQCAGLSAPLLVLCTGYSAKFDPLLSRIRWKAASGTYLLIKTGKPRPEGFTSHKPAITNANLPLAALPGGVFLQHFLLPEDEQGIHWRFGANYQWALPQSLQDDAKVTADLALALEQLLDELLGNEHQSTWQTQGSISAVRPICDDRNPIIGKVPEHGGLYVLNGLGARGFMYAPACALELANHMLQGNALTKTWDLARFY